MSLDTKSEFHDEKVKLGLAKSESKISEEDVEAENWIEQMIENCKWTEMIKLAKVLSKKEKLT